MKTNKHLSSEERDKITILQGEGLSATGAIFCTNFLFTQSPNHLIT